MHLLRPLNVPERLDRSITKAGRYVVFALSLSLILGLVAYTVWKPAVGHGGNTRAAPLRVVLFAPPQPSRDMGVVSAGGRVEVPLVLVNEGTDVVTLGEVTTSCECLGVSLDRREIMAGASVGGTVVLDLGKEPSFRGRLLLTAEAKVAGNSARRAFMIRLDVDVR